MQEPPGREFVRAVLGKTRSTHLQELLGKAAQRKTRTLHVKRNMLLLP